MMNNDCQEYDCGMESLLLRSNEPFYLSSNLLNKRQVMVTELGTVTLPKADGQLSIYRQVKPL